MNLENYFNLNFALMQFHKYSLTEIENMMPWERDIYVAMLMNHLEEEKLKQQQANGINEERIPEGLDDLLGDIRSEKSLNFYC